MYSPKRPIIDISEIFLWLMAVGTVIGASFWSALTAKEAALEHYRSIKVQIFSNFLHIVTVRETPIILVRCLETKVVKECLGEEPNFFGLKQFFSNMYEECLLYFALCSRLFVVSSPDSCFREPIIV